MEKVVVDTWEEAEIDLPFGARGQIYLPCPKCSHLRRNHRGKCLSIDVERGIFHCFNCDYRGGVRSQMSMTPRPKKEYKRPEPPPPADESNPLPQEAIDWFAKRSISESTVRYHDITVSRHWFPQIEREAPCLTFPYYNAEGLINVKYRRAAEKMFTMEKNAEPIFWGLGSDVAHTSFCVIVEGEMDKMACFEAGIIPVLSVPSGAPPEGSRPNLDYFASGEELFDRVDKVILATDGDGPGTTLADELARRIGLEKCYRVHWPEGCKDANDVLMKMGKSELYGVIADAKPFPVSGIFLVDDFREKLEQLYEQGIPEGFEIGMGLEGKYVIHPGYLSVITGIPSHGKSEFVAQIAVNLAETYNWSFGVYSPESWPPERYIAGIQSKHTRKPFFLTKWWKRMTRQEFDDSKAWANEHFYTINPEHPSLDEILDKAKTLVRRDGVSGIIIDPWNTVESERPKDIPEYEWAGLCLLQMQLFARNHGVHIFLVAHPRKMNKAPGDTKVPIPTGYDISGSSMFLNRADVLVVIFRDKSQPGSPVQCIVEKRRNREFGEIGTYQLRFMPEYEGFLGWDDFEQEPEVRQEDVRQPPDDWGNLVPLPGVWGDGR